jgi:mRNA interferase MazF
VKQGDIIKINFDPQIGHEQAGYRPAIVVSNNFALSKTNIVLVCPITNTDRNFPVHIPLDHRTQTTGVVLCEHLRSVDLLKRPYKFIETLPDDLLREVVDVIYGLIEI